MSAWFAPVVKPRDKVRILRARDELCTRRALRVPALARSLLGALSYESEREPFWEIRRIIRASLFAVASSDGEIRACTQLRGAIVAIVDSFAMSTSARCKALEMYCTRDVLDRGQLVTLEFGLRVGCR
jgi:hypothetical protein